MMWMMLAAVASAATPKDAKALFARYEALSDAFDPASIELYADDATIYVDTEGKVVEMGLQDLRPMWNNMLEAAKETGERSTYKKVKVKRTDRGFRITALRHSVRHCFDDKSYEMMLEERDGELLIVSERLSTPGLSRCPAEPSLAASLDAVGLRDP